jgi:uncharacterized protein
MVKKKSSNNRKPKKKTKPRKNKKDDVLIAQLQRTIIGLLILVVVVIAVGYFLKFIFPSTKPSPPPIKKQVIQEEPKKIPPYEIYPKEKIEKPKKALPVKPRKGMKPKIAIIIDDIGYDRPIVRKFISLKIPITFSILPFSPFQTQIAEMANTNGIELMLHLPMEPDEYPKINPGPGALLTTMTPDQLIDQLNRNIDSLPNIKGVNNHMGSKMTAVSTQMYQIFSVLKKRELFFIDSKTTTGSLCKPSARLLQVPFAERNVFLDHIPETAFIEKQLKLLIQYAYAHGEAIGIAHPHQKTYEVLREKLTDNLRQKIDLVPASQIVDIVG